MEIQKLLEEIKDSKEEFKILLKFYYEYAQTVHHRERLFMQYWSFQMQDALIIAQNSVKIIEKRLLELYETN